MENKFHFPVFYWHLEISSKCALSCPRCPRTGEENKNKYKVTELSLTSIQNIFSRSFLRKDVQKVLFCGGQGDPIYHSELHEIVRYLKQSNPELELVFVTNGSHRKRDWWQALARELNVNDRIVFSIDGWDQKSNQKYRVGSHFESILIGIDEMVKGPTIVCWSTIVFEFNQHKIEEIQELDRSRGVNYFNITFSTKFGRDYADATGHDPLEPKKNFRSRYGSYERFAKLLNPKIQKQSRIPAQMQERIPQWSKDDFLPRCMIGERGLYIDASGIFYPCSWISHPHDMPLNLGQKNLWLDKPSRFSVIERTLEEVLNDPIWKEFFATWANQENIYFTCREKCTGRQTHLENLRRREVPDLHLSPPRELRN